jgi:hypothetical protein
VPFFAGNKAPFFAAFRSAKKGPFSRKISRKTGSTQLTAQNWTIFRRISHREKYNFSPFFRFAKKVPFFRFAKKVPFSPHFAPRKKVPFSRKISRKTVSTQLGTVSTLSTRRFKNV